jgi:predicted Zn-dependent protease with MMP-like domain
LRFGLLDFAGAREAAERARQLEEDPEALDVLCRLAERDGDLKAADRLARRAHALDAEGYPLPCRVDSDEFQRLVEAALAEIPERFRAALAGEVAILVRAVPPLDVLQGGTEPLDPELLGLYVGIPVTERTSDHAALPDRIYLFQHNLEHAATSRSELVEQIRITVFHEVGHYFGFSDEELEERDFG